MQENLNGETPYNYFTKFKSLVRKAKKDKLLIDDPTEDIKVIRDEGLKKDILDFAEIQTLAGAYCGNDQVKKAFLFSLNTGLRWCDVKVLKWSSINLSECQMSVSQSKTGEQVATPLNETAIKLLGTAKKQTDLVFNLPTANGANKTDKAWVKRAKIEKAITWHNARHSFGTNLIFNEVDVLTASKLLGHTSMKHTQRYVKASAEMKQNATNKVNFEL